MTDSKPSARAVRFDRYGGPEVYYVADIPVPEPGEGEVVVEIRAAGINPGEAAIRRGYLHDRLPATFPSGQGSDLAGVVTAVGPGVDDLVVGDEVAGYSWTRSSHATHTAVPAAQLVAKPPGLAWEVAGAMFVAGTTALAAVRAAAAQSGETLVISAAAGGVGSLATQLAVRRGARVLALASEANAEWLTTHGAEPVTHGAGMDERVRAAAGPGGVQALIDLFGPEYLDLAVALGVPADRTVTIISFARAAELGAIVTGSAEASTRADLAELIALLATGDLELPVAATYPLDGVVEAFEELEARHTRGKIVLIP